MIPRVTVPHAMGDAFAERLFEFAIARRETAEQGRVHDGTSEGRLDATVRAALVIPDLGSLSDELTAAVGARLPQVCAALGIPPFEPAGAQVTMLAYGDGTFYRRHIDTMLKPQPGEATRRITFVYYFHREPKSFSGGALRLYDVRQVESIDLDPQRDTFIAFPSWMSHEVLPVSCPTGSFADGRFAVNVWVLGRPLTAAAPDR